MASIVRVKPNEVYAKDGTGPLDSDRLLSYICPLCNHILNDPMQGECGDRFCKSCLDEKLVEEFDCPRCFEQVKRADMFPDRGCKREVNALQTMCDCQKLISLAQYSTHVVQDCPAIKTPCSFGCGQTYSMSEMKKHLSSCPMKTVACKHCKQQVTEGELQEHYEVCPEHPNECPYCFATFDDKSKMGQHLSYECEEKRHSCFLCGKVGNKEKMKDHIDNNHSFLLIKQLEVVNVQIFQMNARIEHLEREKLETSRSSAETVEHFKKVISSQTSKLAEQQERSKKIFENQTSKITALENELKSVKQELLVTTKSPRFDEVEKDSPGTAKPTDTFRSHTSNISHLVPFVSKSAPSSLQSTNQPNSLEEMKSDVMRVVNQAKEEMLNRATQQETSLEYSKSEIEKIFKLLQAQDDNIMKQKHLLEDIHLRQELQEVKATKGVFIWKINELGRRKQDANDGRVLSLYSPPFFTSFHGYRMCIRCYLNGDGSGKGTHISVFFVVMKSEHDDLLPWPFKQKVTISLLNQELPFDSSAHITQSFMPDAKSSSFQKPTKDMNIASGFPKFASRSVLNEKKYSQNDTIYFKVRVDLSDIPQD